MTEPTKVHGPTKATVAPLLSVRAGSAAIDFYKTAFGAVEKFRTDERGRSRLWPNSPLGECDFWLADEAPDHFSTPAPRLWAALQSAWSSSSTIPTPASTAQSLLDRKPFGRWSTSPMAGGSAASSIPSAIIGRSASH